MRGSKNGLPVEDVDEDLLESIRANGACFKGTLFTPLSATNTSTQSYNVRLRKELDLGVSVVQGVCLPGVPTRHAGVNIVIIRENTEGEYSGLEHEVVPDVVESLKVVTAEKSRRVAEYAFTWASLNNRKKIHVIHKANIMKLTDGLFIQCAAEVAKKYEGIVDVDYHIVDNAAQQLVQRPTQYSALLMGNAYGAILGNILAGIVGSAGLLPGANIGPGVAVFEQGARHVAQNIAGKGVANPVAALLAIGMMLRHLHLPDFCDRLEAAMLGALAEEPASCKPPDIGGTGTTATLMKAIVDRLKEASV